MMVDIEEVMREAGLTPESFEKQLTEIIDKMHPAPDSDVVGARQYLREKVTVRICTAALAKAREYD